MIVLDANILLYAYDSASPDHVKSREHVQELFSGDMPVGLTWQTISAFLRVITHPRLPGERLSPGRAVAIVDSWLAQPNVLLLIAGEGHWMRLRSLILDGEISGNLISDAQLAALTMEYGGELHTADRDFARFPGLRWKNPLL